MEYKRTQTNSFIFVAQGLAEAMSNVPNIFVVIVLYFFRILADRKLVQSNAVLKEPGFIF
jgi:hypothetical protein